MSYEDARAVFAGLALMLAVGIVGVGVLWVVELRRRRRDYRMVEEWWEACSVGTYFSREAMEKRGTIGPQQSPSSARGSS